MKKWYAQRSDLQCDINRLQNVIQEMQDTTEVVAPDPLEIQLLETQKQLNETLQRQKTIYDSKTATLGSFNLQTALPFHRQVSDTATSQQTMSETNQEMGRSILQRRTSMLSPNYTGMPASPTAFSGFEMPPTTGILNSPSTQ